MQRSEAGKTYGTRFIILLLPIEHLAIFSRFSVRNGMPKTLKVFAISLLLVTGFGLFCDLLCDQSADALSRIPAGC